VTHKAHKQQCSHRSKLHTWRQPIKEGEETSTLGLLRVAAAAAAAAAASPAAHQQPLLLLLRLL
jgi:hypothetical protein